jgi:UDP-N-acetylmuramyl pentapeptide synthase
MTPGVVELGSKRSKQVHRALADRYAHEVDLTLLIKTEGTGFVIERFKEIGYNRFKLHKTAKEAHEDLAHVLQNGDTILFQNDVTDNYS